jgi:putative Mn2+ efflux pump MntP
MEIISILLVGIALSVDTFSISITAGASTKNIKIYESLLIATYFGFFHWFMTVLGWLGGTLFNGYIYKYDHWLAFILLILIGGKMIQESFNEKDTKKFVFSHKVLFGLAIATGVDAFGVGLSYSLIDKPIYTISALIGIIVFILSYLGVYLGDLLNKIIRNKMELIGGLVLMIIGVKIVFDHGFLINSFF